jgi:hypothetical protein
VAEYETHQEEDESQAKQMDVRYPHQGKKVGASVVLNHRLHVVKTVQVRQVRIAAVMTAQAVV